MSNGTVHVGWRLTTQNLHLLGDTHDIGLLWIEELMTRFVASRSREEDSLKEVAEDVYLS